MHRPGIASVLGNTIMLDGTTMDEVETYHVKTLNLCVQRANEEEAARVELVRAAQERDEAARRKHEHEVDEIADRLRFDEDES